MNNPILKILTYTFCGCIFCGCVSEDIQPDPVPGPFCTTITPDFTRLPPNGGKVIAKVGLAPLCDSYEFVLVTESNTDGSGIENIVYTKSESEKASKISGKWFTVKIDPDNAANLILDIETNNTGKDRQLRVTVSQRGLAIEEVPGTILVRQNCD